jgi:hypothetical protein
MTIWDMMLWTAVAIPVGFIAMAFVNAASELESPGPFE